MLRRQQLSSLAALQLGQLCHASDARRTQLVVRVVHTARREEHHDGKPAGCVCTAMCRGMAVAPNSLDGRQPFTAAPAEDRTGNKGSEGAVIRQLGRTTLQRHASAKLQSWHSGLLGCGRTVPVHTWREHHGCVELLQHHPRYWMWEFDERT